MTEYALVPVEELKKLEEARVALHDTLPRDMNTILKLIPATQIMWYIANRKWVKINDNSC